MRLPLFLYLILIVAGSCRERYGLPLNESLAGSLVVEGNILDGDSSIISLTRTSAVERRLLQPEAGALVVIEGSDNTSFAVTETQPGVYKSEALHLNPSVQYRLKITAAGKEYESAWTGVLSTPEMDSIYWERQDGIKIYAQSSGTNEQGRYFKWDYEEVWDYFSPLKSFGYYTYVIDAAGQKSIQCIDKDYRGIKYNTCVMEYGPDGSVYNDSLFHCWKYQTSGNINVASTATLSGNVSRVFLRRIEEDAFEVNNLYCITVKQTALTKEGYDFYKILEGNTESMGSIFDAQPSQLKTNLKCVSDPRETVVGFVNATTVKIKRKFISIRELPGWRYFDYLNCPDTVVYANTMEGVQAAIGFYLLPTKVFVDKRPPFLVLGFGVAPRMCVDCRLRGGIHKRPDFWPQ